MFTKYSTSQCKLVDHVLGIYTWLRNVHVSLIITTIYLHLFRSEHWRYRIVFPVFASMMTSKLLLLVCYVSLLCLVSSSSLSSDLSGKSQPSSSKVSLGLYYESLCPYCSSFIVNHLTKLFEDGLISIVDLHLSPWGNSKLRSDNVTVLCQVFSCFLSIPSL